MLIKETKKRLEKILTDYLGTDHNYLKALEMVRKNSYGKIWLVGGCVYKPIINDLYGLNISIPDVDFVVEKIRSSWIAEQGWAKHKNRYDNPRLVSDDGVTIDFTPLRGIRSVKKISCQPTLNDFMKVMPYTVQLISYDTDKRTLLGSRGIQSILTRRIAVNNRGQLKLIACLKGMSERDLFLAKASELRFDIEE